MTYKSIMDIIIEAFTSTTNCREVVMNILNMITEEIPTAKWKYLLKTYPVIPTFIQYLKDHRWKRYRIKVALNVIECLLGISQNDIGNLCMTQIKQFSETNVFHSMPASDPETSSTLNRIINMYFTD